MTLGGLNIGKIPNYRYIGNENIGNYRRDLKVVLDRDSSES